MTTNDGPSGWAVQRFGDYAEPLWALIPAAISVAVNRQIDTHLASGLRSLHAYGGAWPVQHEELVNHVGGLGGVEVVRPAGSAVHLVVVNGHLLVPFRYADDLNMSPKDPRVAQALNKTCRELLAEFGAEPAFEQPMLADDLVPTPDGGAKLLGDFKPEGLVLVAFAANADAGLLAVGWGEAALPVDGSMQWAHFEMLPLPKPPPPAGGRLLPVKGPRPNDLDGGAGARRFDDAPLADPILSPRTPAALDEPGAASGERSQAG